jgi:hypothetical protein
LQSTSTAEHCPGGKVLLPLPIWIRGSAIFGGPNQEYRYELSRTWNESLPTILFVMMNPSTASPEFDDPTVAMDRRYAEDWGFGTLLSSVREDAERAEGMLHPLNLGEEFNNVGRDASSTHADSLRVT